MPRYGAYGGAGGRGATDPWLLQGVVVLVVQMVVGTGCRRR